MVILYMDKITSVELRISQIDISNNLQWIEKK